MKFALATLAIAGVATAVPQGKASAPDADWNAIIGSISTVGPQLLRSAPPGTDPFGAVGQILADLGKGNDAAKLIGNIINKGAGKVADPPGAAPRRVALQSRHPLAKSETVKIRYGPYKIPSASTKNLLGEGGTLFNFPDVHVPKPCEGDCMLLGINAGLEYPDGKSANIDNGLWLHHMVLVAEGPGRWDATCVGNRRSLPHMLVGTNSNSSERIFSSGNERTPAIIGSWKLPDAGIKLVDQDKFSLIVDLMNTNDKEEVAYLTLTYDVVAGHPQGVDELKPVWFDVAQCGTSEVVPMQQTGSWELNAKTWVANFDGEVMGAAGHLHDGGTNIQLLTDGKLACDSAATYGGSPEFIGKGMGDHHGGSSAHISNMSLCLSGKNFGGVKEIKVGQKWDLKALYDYNKYPGMSHGDGKQDNVMGIAIMFARLKK